MHTGDLSISNQEHESQHRHLRIAIKSTRRTCSGVRGALITCIVETDRTLAPLEGSRGNGMVDPWLDLNALLVSVPHGQDRHSRSSTVHEDCLEGTSMAQKTQFVCPVHQCRFVHLCDFPDAGTIMQQQYVHVLQNHCTAVWYLVSAIPNSRHEILRVRPSG